jgi:UDP-N-acetylglucosamine 2-epimerase (non-hydrolysing)
MIVVFYGTSAELIKMYGIVSLVPRDELLLVCSAQHHQGLQKVHAQLGIEPDLYLSNGWRGNDVANMKQMLGMMLHAHGRFLAKYSNIRKRIKESDKKNGTRSIVLVHGDTLTTVIGAYMGRLLRLPVGHVEAGLRSGTWKNPFPEELDRRFVSKIARIHFAPNDLASKNLVREKTKGEIIDTQFNTAKDAIEESGKFVSREFSKLKLPEHYCLVLLHRTELLESRDDLEAILKAINKHASKERPVVFTEHTTTKEKINANSFDHYLQKDGLIVIPKQPYFDFMAIVRNSDYIVTDGGGLQEDAYFFGIPTMVHRLTTERHEGIGENADISKMDVAKVTDFLENHRDKSEFAGSKGSVSPSEIVVDWLRSHNYFTAPR